MRTEYPAFDTLTEAVNWLQSEGYVYDFNLDNDCLRYGADKTRLEPEDFKIDKVYRFEGDTDPGDENVLYAISSNHPSVKGMLISAFGAYADSLTSDMVSKLAVVN